MKIAVFSTRAFARHSLDETNRHFGHQLVYYRREFESGDRNYGGKRPGFVHRMAQRYPDSPCAFDRVTLHRCRQCRSRCCTEAVAEHAVALVLAPHRNIQWTYNRVWEGNFDLNGSDIR